MEWEDKIKLVQLGNIMNDSDEDKLNLQNKHAVDLEKLRQEGRVKLEGIKEVIKN